MHIYSPATGVGQLSAGTELRRLPVPETLISGGSEAEFVDQLSDAWFQEWIRHGPDDPY
jgi:hypothetical protein